MKNKIIEKLNKFNDEDIASFEFIIEQDRCTAIVCLLEPYHDDILDRRNGKYRLLYDHFVVSVQIFQNGKPSLSHYSNKERAEAIASAIKGLSQ